MWQVVGDEPPSRRGPLGHSLGIQTAAQRFSFLAEPLDFGREPLLGSFGGFGARALGLACGFGRFGASAVCFGALSLGVGAVLFKVTLLTGRQQSQTCRGIIQAELAPILLQVQTQDFAGQPAAHRLDRYILAPYQPEPPERRLEIILSR